MEFIFDAQFGNVSVSFIDSETGEQLGWVWKRSEFEQETGITLPDAYYAHYEDGKPIVFIDKGVLADQETTERFGREIARNIFKLRDIVQAKIQKQQEEAARAAARVEQEQRELEQRLRDLEEFAVQVLGGGLS